MGILGLILRALSLMMMYIISNPKAIKLQSPEEKLENIETLPNT